MAMEKLTFNTSDISFAAFLVMRGKRLMKVSRERGKFEFIFENFSEDEIELEQQYVGSELPRYDAALRQIKRKLYGP